jgi:tRNA (mo5U34)-methyltransferase
MRFLLVCRIELPGGVVTPGFSPLNVKSYGVRTTLSGKRVLDVGAWDGHWTFEALRRGARAVRRDRRFFRLPRQARQSDRRAWEPLISAARR